MNNNSHTPLFLKQIMALLKEYKVTKVIDGTFGEGGHGLNLAKLGYQVLGIEWDQEMYKIAQNNIKEAKTNKVKLVLGNYKNVAKIAKENHFSSVGAVIFDLGLSMYQLINSSRGFSYQRQGDLDLRISQSLPQTAKDWLNHTSRLELTDDITRYIEDKRSTALSRAILFTREKKPFSCLEDLRAVVTKITDNEKEATKLLRQALQALRIVINDEMTNIKQGFTDGLTILKPQGLLIFLTYHSLEDRVVKRLGQEYSSQLKSVQKVISNKDYQFAKSGKLRVYEKIN